MHDAPFPSTLPFLFFEREQLAIQTSDLIYSFILTSKDCGDILAVFHCIPAPQEWISPPLAPFGGILPLAHCREDQLTFLLGCIRDWVFSKGGKSISIKTMPSCYAPKTHELSHRSYLAAGFLPNHTDSNRYIPIADHPFDQNIEPTEKRRLAKGKKAGLRVTIKHGICDHTEENFLRQCYQAKGYQFPVLPAELIRVASAFPKKYVIITTWLEDDPAAMAVMVRVSDDVLYHFMSGYRPEYRALSPSLLLFEAAFDYCRQEKIRILDLGVSIDHHGKPKPSLSRFKVGIGGLECEKISYKAEF